MELKKFDSKKKTLCQSNGPKIPIHITDYTYNCQGKLFLSFFESKTLQLG